MSKGDKKTNLYKHVLVSEDNYIRLKMLGYAGESYNDVITRILKNKNLVQETRVGSSSLELSST